jgi:hypothetical protein
VPVARRKHHLHADRKNVFLWPGRDWLRKAFEAYFTVLIELVWSKQRIMEIYPMWWNGGRAFTALKRSPSTIFISPQPH